MATFAQQELMKYSETTHHLQHFLNTTCVDILWAQSPQTGACQAQWGAGGGSPCSWPSSLGNWGDVPLLLLAGKHRGRSHAPLVLGLILGVSAVVGMAVGIFLCTGGSC